MQFCGSYRTISHTVNTVDGYLPTFLLILVDLAAGRKILFLPPEYKGEVPEGFGGITSAGPANHARLIAECDCGAVGVSHGASQFHHILQENRYRPSRCPRISLSISRISVSARSGTIRAGGA